MDVKLMISLMLLLITTGASARAAPEIRSASPQLVNFDMDTANMPQSYKFNYHTSDGTSRAEQGQINSPGSPEAALSVQGSSRWVTDDGSVYEMTYKAGKRGYRTIIKKLKPPYQNS